MAIRHILSIASLAKPQIVQLLDHADAMVALSRKKSKRLDVLRGRTLINLFFEPSTRTLASFELAGKRLGADVVNMAMDRSSLRKGETLSDTIATLNAMRPDVIVVRHFAAGVPNLISHKVGCSVINAGDGAHEHPTQALLDALTIRRNFGRLSNLQVVIAGDVLHSRVARSNLLLFRKFGAQVTVCGPRTLTSSHFVDLGAKVSTTLDSCLETADVIMMLRLQRERSDHSRLPSPSEFFRFFGLTRERRRLLKASALILHPGPLNRGVEIDGDVADGAQSRIGTQVEMGVAVRMACLERVLA